MLEKLSDVPGSVLGFRASGELTGDVVTDRGWLRHSVGIFGYLIPGQIRAFAAAQEDEARAWVAS